MAGLKEWPGDESDILGNISGQRKGIAALLKEVRLVIAVSSAADKKG